MFTLHVCLQTRQGHRCGNGRLRHSARNAGSAHVPRRPRRPVLVATLRGRRRRIRRRQRDDDDVDTRGHGRSGSGVHVPRPVSSHAGGPRRRLPVVLPEVIHSAVPRLFRRRSRPLRPHLSLGARAPRAPPATEARDDDARPDDDDGAAQRRRRDDGGGGDGRRRRRDDDHDGAEGRQHDSRRGQSGLQRRRQESETMVADDAREKPHRKSEDGRHLVRRNTRVRRHVPASIPHGATAHTVPDVHLLHVLRQQYCEPSHLFVHEQNIQRRPAQTLSTTLNVH